MSGRVLLLSHTVQCCHTLFIVGFCPTISVAGHSVTFVRKFMEVCVGLWNSLSLFVECCCFLFVLFVCVCCAQAFFGLILCFYPGLNFYLLDCNLIRFLFNCATINAFFAFVLCLLPSIFYNCVLLCLSNTHSSNGF